MDDVMNYYPQVASGVSSVAQDTINYINSPQGKFAQSFDNILDNLSGVRDYNNLWSAEQAALQRDWSSYEAEKNRMYNMIEAAKNREWQSYQSSTAHQREVQDLLAAGLNPILSAMGGNGAAVGSGATAAGVGNPSGVSANSDESTGMAIASILSTVLSNQTRLQEMTMSAELQRELTDKQLAQNEFLSLLGFDVSRSNALSSAGAILGSALTAANASMYNTDYQYWNSAEQRNWQGKENYLGRVFEGVQKALDRISNKDINSSKNKTSIDIVKREQEGLNLRQAISQMFQGRQNTLSRQNQRDIAQGNNTASIIGSLVDAFTLFS